MTFPVRPIRRPRKRCRSSASRGCAGRSDSGSSSAPTSPGSRASRRSARRRGPPPRAGHGAAGSRLQPGRPRSASLARRGRARPRSWGRRSRAGAARGSAAGRSWGRRGSSVPASRPVCHAAERFGTRHPRTARPVSVTVPRRATPQSRRERRAHRRARPGCRSRTCGFARPWRGLADRPGPPPAGGGPTRCDGDGGDDAHTRPRVPIVGRAWPCRAHRRPGRSAASAGAWRRWQPGGRASCDDHRHTATDAASNGGSDRPSAARAVRTGRRRRRHRAGARPRRSPPRRSPPRRSRRTAGAGSGGARPAGARPAGARTDRHTGTRRHLVRWLELRPGRELVRPGVLRQSDGVRPDVLDVDHGRRSQDASVRCGRHLPQPGQRAGGHGAGDRPRPVRGRPKLGPERRHVQRARALLHRPDRVAIP